MSQGESSRPRRLAQRAQAAAPAGDAVVQARVAGRGLDVQADPVEPRQQRRQAFGLSGVGVGLVQSAGRGLSHGHLLVGEARGAHHGMDPVGDGRPGVLVNHLGMGEIHQHRSAALAGGLAGRTEAAAQESAEAEILSRYLPAAMSDDELLVIVTEEVAAAVAAGNEGAKAMGLVVKAVRARAGSSADGAKIAALVKSALG